MADGMEPTIDNKLNYTVAKTSYVDSKGHFCRTFKSVTGQPPMEYLRLFRLRVAHVLLSNTEF